jgi:class 3 adenylate cyclase
MTAEAEVVDFSDVGLDRRRRRRQRRRRILLPILGVAIIVAAILAIASYSYQSNRTGVLALSQDVLESLDRRIRTEVATYIQPAGQMVRLLTQIAAELVVPTDRRRVGEAVATNVLRTHEQLTSVYYGQANGDFLMVKTMADGALDTKEITRGDGPAKVTWTRRDPQGGTRAVDVEPDDGYDPRQRPWYGSALAGPGVAWTDVYVFFTDRKPGITASLAMRDREGKVLGVAGIDIALERLSHFLAGLKVGRTGRAMILDGSGRLVAYPDTERMLEERDGKLVPKRADELGDPVVARAYNRFRVEGHGQRDLEVDGRRYISTATSLRDIVDRDWTVLIVVPEEDFVGFVQRNNRTALSLSFGVVALAALMAWWLILQGLRADRNAQLVLDRQQAMARQGEAFADLARRAATFEPQDRASLTALTERVAAATGVRRVSAWQLDAAARVLRCLDAYDRDGGGHVAGLELPGDRLPQLFARLAEGRELVATQAANVPATAELHRLYLRRFDCRSLAAVPVRAGGDVVGQLWLEDSDLTGDELHQAAGFAQAVADLLGLRLSAGPATRAEAPAGAPSAAPRHAGVDVAPAGPGGGTTLARQLAERGGKAELLAARVHPDCSVMVLRFADHVGLAERSREDAGISVADQLVRWVETRAAELGIDFVKVLSDQVLAAEGIDGDTQGGANRLADLALAIQERCVRLQTRHETRLDFRIGFDSGTVIGSPVGGAARGYNLWGDAVRIAEAMADSGVPGEIQVTAASYRLLRDAYLFRPRGAYYVEGIGETATYLLAGRT